MHIVVTAAQKRCYFIFPRSLFSWYPIVFTNTTTRLCSMFFSFLFELFAFSLTLKLWTWRQTFLFHKTHGIHLEILSNQSYFLKTVVTSVLLVLSLQSNSLFDTYDCGGELLVFWKDAIKIRRMCPRAGTQEHKCSQLFVVGSLITLNWKQPYTGLYCTFYESIT